MLLSLTSCDDFLDVNETPTGFTAENVSPELILAGAILNTYDAHMRGANQLGNVFMQNWASDVNNFTGGNLTIYQLEITPSFWGIIWDGMYQDLSSLQAIIDFEGGNYAHHKAISRILKTFYMQQIVDIYGDVPYSQALLQGENLNPGYDDAQSIYRDFIVQLDLAIQEANTTEEVTVVGGEDVIFAGNMDSWIRLANTLKLRILIRESGVSGSAAYIADEFANLDLNFITSDVVVNPPYENIANKQSPFYALYGADAAGNGSERSGNVAAGYVAEFLKGNATPGASSVSTGVYDTRVERLFALESGVVNGAEQGVLSTATVLSGFGPGTLIGSEQVGWLFTNAESLFLQSEAVQNGWITSGNAKALFEQGITASFNLLGAASDASGYITSSQSVNLIGWDGSANKIEAIMTQKWIALNSINGGESWIEYTRTGFPDVPLALTAQRPARPVRLMYPDSEYAANSANVPAQTQDDAFSDRIFWDIN